MLFFKIFRLGAVAAFSSHALAMAAAGTEEQADLEARGARTGTEPQQQPQAGEGAGSNAINSHAAYGRAGEPLAAGNRMPMASRHPGRGGRHSQLRSGRSGGNLPTIDEDPYGLLPTKNQRNRPLVYTSRDGTTVRERTYSDDDPSVPQPMPKKGIGQSVRTFRAKRPIAASAGILAAA